jgi:hypothetical protein
VVKAIHAPRQGHNNESEKATAIMKLLPLGWLTALTAIRSINGFQGRIGYDRSISGFRSSWYVENEIPRSCVTSINYGSKQSDESDNPHNSSRRTLLSGMILATCSSMIGIFAGPSGTASAVDFSVPDMSIFTSGPNKQRLGGLANKIRNSCRIMVNFGHRYSKMDRNWQLLLSHYFLPRCIATGRAST